MHIFETYNPGAIVSIQAKKSGKWEVLWSGNKPETLKAESRVFTPPLKVCKNGYIDFFQSSWLRDRGVYSSNIPPRSGWGRFSSHNIRVASERGRGEEKMGRGEEKRGRGEEKRGRGEEKRGEGKKKMLGEGKRIY